MPSSYGNNSVQYSPLRNNAAKKQHTHRGSTSTSTLESSFCFTYAPLAAVRTLFSIMNMYPSRSKAKSSLQNTKHVKTRDGIHTHAAWIMSAYSYTCMWPSHLAAIKAPKIIVNTVSLTGVENVFLSKSPSNTMVRQILNLLKTVNIGKLSRCVPKSPDI